MIERNSLAYHLESSKYSLGPARRLFPPHLIGRSSVLLLALAAYFTPVRSQQGGPIRIIVSDELTECVPTNITWTGGTPPYTLGIGVPNLDHGPTEEFSNISQTFFVWSTDVAAENSVMFAVGDNATITRSGFIDINAGLTQSCIPEPVPASTSTAKTQTQGAQASSGSPGVGQPLSTSTSIASTTVTVSVTDSVGGTNAATPSTTTTNNSTSGSSHSTLSPDVIGIIVAVAVALLIVVIWVLYKRSVRAKQVIDSNASTPPAPQGPVSVAPYHNPPTSPTIRATSILSPSPNYSPVGSPPMSALQFAPYGYSPPPPPPPPPAPLPHPAWQGAGAVHTTQTQTQMYFLGDPSLASRAPSVMSRETSTWNAQEAYTYPYMPQGRVQQDPVGPLAIEFEQGRGADAGTPGLGAATVASTEGGSDWRDNALLARPPARSP
ncbi:hypothetical protein GSI_08647 [Ganoderma sinense ZZ0214-1]|uniref:Uncharacterized protein n=1 Tax=Ganoderma sinense ZZ0214-1 TaxID=1077348 RepID=A0A2G8S4D5_9APHY|nr:hypothetical protein GSI_08647 [Ganoderma sinense ZZ0214-1]